MKKFKSIVLFLFVFILLTTATYAADTSTIDINVPSAILIERNTGKILYEKSADEIRYPASTTKIMTAILALENCELTDVATVSYDAIMTIPEGYTNANLQLGEELTIEQLLHLLLIPSASDAANTLAEHIAGSIASFATMMNTKAAELGCTNTHFMNPDGQHDENHYSTAYDLSLIANYAMNFEAFRNIVSKSSYILYPTNKYDEERYYSNTNLLLNKNYSKYYYEKAIGTKTGFTTPAGNCLVATAKDGDLELITVVLGAGQDDNGLSERFLGTISLFDFGFDNYTYRTIKNKNDIITEIDIDNATKETRKLNLLASEEIYSLIDKVESNASFEPNISLNENIQAPILQGDILGTATYQIDGVTYTTNLIAANDVFESHFFLYISLSGFLVLIVFGTLYIKKNNKKKNKRNKRNYRINQY